MMNLKGISFQVADASQLCNRVYKSIQRSFNDKNKKVQLLIKT